MDPYLAQGVVYNGDTLKDTAFERDIRWVSNIPDDTECPGDNPNEVYMLSHLCDLLSVLNYIIKVWDPSTSPKPKMLFPNVSGSCRWLLVLSYMFPKFEYHLYGVDQMDLSLQQMDQNNPLTVVNSNVYLYKRPFDSDDENAWIVKGCDLYMAFLKPQAEADVLLNSLKPKTSLSQYNPDVDSDVHLVGKLFRRVYPRHRDELYDLITGPKFTKSVSFKKDITKPTHACYHSPNDGPLTDSQYSYSYNKSEYFSILKSYIAKVSPGNDTVDDTISLFTYIESVLEVYI